MMQLILIFVFLLLVGGWLYMRHDRFGADAKGERLARMQGKPNYHDGAFANLEPTPAIAEGARYTDMFWQFFFAKKIRNAPQDSLPVVQTNLHELPLDSNLYVWFGHSSYYIQLDGKKILVDPVFSKYASPVRMGVKAFKSSYSYRPEDMPEVDLLFISHDHWDHLDYNTFMAIKHKVKHIVTGLGVGAHLEKWGYPSNQISELYWGDRVQLDGLQITATPGRHFSGRSFKRNTTLWSSFVLAGSKKLFLGGDSGYGQHFKAIGKEYGPFDFAILENGQYDKMWPYIHMQPEEVIQATQDLAAHVLIPVHSSKFPLANHPWDEPLIRISEAAEAQEQALIMPKLGEVVYMEAQPENKAWWKGLR